jgi:hypothetical protein
VYLASGGNLNTEWPWLCCNSAKGKKITANALELAGAHGVTISMDIGHYRAGVLRRAATSSRNERFVP